MDDEQRETLNALMAENERLYQAYLPKEQALDIFDERDKENALKRLDKWFVNVKEAGYRNLTRSSKPSDHTSTGSRTTSNIG